MSGPLPGQGVVVTGAVHGIGRALATRMAAGDFALEPEEIAEAMWQALRDDRFLVLSHPEVAEYYRRRAADPDRWLAGMNTLQRWLEDHG